MAKLKKVTKATIKSIIKKLRMNPEDFKIEDFKIECLLKDVEESNKSITAIGKEIVECGVNVTVFCNSYGAEILRLGKCF